MIINRALLTEGNKQHYSEDVDFSDYVGDPNHCKKIENCHVEVDVLELETLCLVSINGLANVVTSCKYTLEDLPLRVTFKEDLTFSDDENDESSYYEPKVEIDLKPYILGLILDKVPHNAVKKGVSKPKNGDGYRILSEDEYNEEKKNKKDPRWAKLDEIEF